MQISKRLEMVAGMITPGCILADVGTDHAYIPIYLAAGGNIQRAFAMDVNKGPLAKAVEHIRQYGLEEKIETRLSDGLEKLNPGEADSILIAGMGGPLTIRILENGEKTALAAKELILQPQSEIRAVREWLEKKGFQIIQEEMVEEDGKYYPMMKVVKAEKEEYAEKMNPAELRYGPLLLKQKHPVLKEFLIREYELNERILSALEGKDTETSVQRKEQVEYEQVIIRDVLCAMDK